MQPPLPQRLSEEDSHTNMSAFLFKQSEGTGAHCACALSEWAESARSHGEEYGVQCACADCKAHRRSSVRMRRP